MQAAYNTNSLHDERVLLYGKVPGLDLYFTSIRTDPAHVITAGYIGAYDTAVDDLQQ